MSILKQISEKNSTTQKPLNRFAPHINSLISMQHEFSSKDVSKQISVQVFQIKEPHPLTDQANRYNSQISRSKITTLILL